MRNESNIKSVNWIDIIQKKKNWKLVKKIEIHFVFWLDRGNDFPLTSDH